MTRTQEAIEQRLQTEYPRGVELYYVDYRDELSQEQIKDIFEGKEVDIFDEWYVDETINEIINEVFSAEEQDDLDADIEDWIMIASDWLYCNDTSKPYERLCNNTWPVRVRVQLQSNYDCWSSDRLTSQEWYSYEESYLWDVLDFCEISPSEFKKLLVASGRKVVGKRPKKKHNPLVEPKDLLGEMFETTAGWVLCFAGSIDISMIKDWIKKIEIGTGTRVWCHNDWCWTCSMYEAKTIRNIDVEIDKPLKNNWYTVTICMDNDWYGIDDICWMGGDFREETIGVLFPKE